MHNNQLIILLSPHFVFRFYSFGPFFFTPFSLEKLLFLSFGLTFLSQRTIRLSLSRSPFLFFSFPLFCPLFFLPFGIVFIGAGEAGLTLPRLIADHAWGAHASCSATAPSEVANGGVACGSRLLCHLIMRRVGSDFGCNRACGKGEEETRRRKQKKHLSPCCMSKGRRRNSAASKRHYFVFFFKYA